MLRIQRRTNGETTFQLSGRLDTNNVFELQTQIASESKGRPIILDLKDLTLVDREAVRFLGEVESNGTELLNCPLYVSEWIRRERNAK